eukprot:1161989-Pelagomonas_calceolata.AAC.7
MTNLRAHGQHHAPQRAKPRLCTAHGAAQNVSRARGPATGLACCMAHPEMPHSGIGIAQPTPRGSARWRSYTCHVLHMALPNAMLCVWHSSKCLKGQARVQTFHTSCTLTPIPLRLRSLSDTARSLTSLAL